MSKQKQQKSQQKQAQAKAPKQPKGAMTASAAVRLWQGDTIARSLLVAEQNGLSVLATELTLVKETRTVQVATHKRATVTNGRVHPLDNPITVGTGSFGFDEALTAEEAAARATKWLKRAKSLDTLARQGDEEAKERAKSLRERAKTLAKAYNLVIEKDGSVAVKSEQPTATETK